MADIPTSGEQSLPIHLDRGFATKLPTRQVSIMRGVDKVVSERLLHVLTHVQTIQKDRCVLVRHQIATEAIVTQLLCKVITARDDE